jgi:hypothetical protein
VEPQHGVTRSMVHISSIKTRTLDAFEYNPFSLTEQHEMAHRISMQPKFLPSSLGDSQQLLVVRRAKPTTPINARQISERQRAGSNTISFMHMTTRSSNLDRVEIAKREIIASLAAKGSQDCERLRIHSGLRLCINMNGTTDSSVIPLKIRHDIKHKNHSRLFQHEHSPGRRHSSI